MTGSYLFFGCQIHRSNLPAILEKNYYWLFARMRSTESGLKKGGKHFTSKSPLHLYFSTEKL
jgi:hypothetical protein